MERAIGFYRDVLGFEVTQRLGQEAAFLSAGGYHHHIGLNTWESAGGRAPAPGTTGLYHVAILYPTRAELGDALRRLRKAGIPLDGASDHGVSEALYLRDRTTMAWSCIGIGPAKNGRGRRRASWRCSRSRSSWSRCSRRTRRANESDESKFGCCSCWLLPRLSGSLPNCGRVGQDYQDWQDSRDSICRIPVIL